MCSAYDDPSTYDPDPLSDPDYIRDAQNDARLEAAFELEQRHRLTAAMYHAAEAEQRAQRNERIHAAVLLFVIIGVVFILGVLVAR